MKHFYSPTNGYCVMDEAPIPVGDWVEVPARPTPEHVWNGSEWAAPTRWASVAAAKADLSAQVDARAEVLRIAVVGTDSRTQMDVYRNKYERALAGDLAFLEAEADARGVSAEQLAAVIIAKAEQWRDAGQAIEAAKGAHKTAIAGMADMSEAEAYSVDAGWPEL